jgi:hypothetical protein
MVLVDVHKKNGEWSLKIHDPRTIVNGDENGFIETDDQVMVSVGKFSNDTIESYLLHLTDNSGWIVGIDIVFFLWF